MDLEQVWPALSVAVAVLALVATTVLLARQVRQMEHERNAVALLEAISRLADAVVIQVFVRLKDIERRYPTDKDILENYRGSQDEQDLLIVGLYVETVAVLARRGALDATMIVDAMGLSLRRRWDTIRTFVERRRRVEQNPYIFENFEWLAMYSAWWKSVPRDPRDPNYDPDQFKDVVFRV